MKQAIASWEPFGRSVVRIILAFTFSLHGYRHLLGVFPPFGGRRGAAPMALDTLPSIAGVIEIAAGFLLLFGLFARAAALVGCLEVLTAYVYAAAPRGLWPIRNGGDEVLLYFLVFLYFAAAGGGAWSVDALLAKPRSRHSKDIPATSAG